MLNRLHAGIDDDAIAGLELGIVVEGFTNCLTFLNCGVYALEGFRKMSSPGVHIKAPDGAGVSATAVAEMLTIRTMR